MLESAETNSFSPDTKAIVIAFCLACAPLLLGCAIFLAWCATSWKWLQAAGMLNIMFGLLACLLAVFFLFAGIMTAMSCRPRNWRALVGSALVVGVVALNFPVCGIIIDTVFRLESAQSAIDQLRQSTLRIFNASEETIPFVSVSGTDFDRDYGPVSSEEGITHSLDDGDQPTLTVRWDDSAEQRTIVLERSPGRVQDIIVMLGPDHRVKVVPLERGFWDPND